MKKIVLISCFVVIFATTGFAQQGEKGGTDKTAQQTLSAEDIKNLRQAFEALRGVVSPENQQQTAQQTQEDHKTVGDVLDKAVDMVDKYATSAFALTAEAAKKVAPEVWRIMILQQYAKALSDILISWGLALVMFVAFLAAGKYWVEKPDESSDETSCRMTIRRILITLTVFFSMSGVVAIALNIQLLINPEYFAIKDLVQIVFGR